MYEDITDRATGPEPPCLPLGDPPHIYTGARSTVSLSLDRYPGRPRLRHFSLLLPPHPLLATHPCPSPFFPHFGAAVHKPARAPPSPPPAHTGSTLARLTLCSETAVCSTPRLSPPLHSALIKAHGNLVLAHRRSS